MCAPRDLRKSLGARFCDAGTGPASRPITNFSPPARSFRGDSLAGVSYRTRHSMAHGHRVHLLYKVASASTTFTTYVVERHFAKEV